MKVGVSVTCPVCHMQKKPRGRSAPLQMSMCDPHECDSYWNDPKVGDLWPGETEEDFGYPVSSDGTVEVAA